MQDRYVADVGDFVKYGLLRRLAAGLRLGVAWYLHPDEGHNNDGKHDASLREPALWADYDPELFAALGPIREQRGGVAAVEQSGVLGSAVFAGERLDFRGTAREREAWRARWFDEAMGAVEGCDIVFADPDNGLCADASYRPARVKDWKRLPHAEVGRLAGGRCAVLYHHNTRRRGGHAVEIADWLRLLPPGSLAIRARAGNSRTFFVVNPSPQIDARARGFARDWASAKVELHELAAG